MGAFIQDGSDHIGDVKDEKDQVLGAAEGDAGARGIHLASQIPEWIGSRSSKS